MSAVDGQRLRALARAAKTDRNGAAPVLTSPTTFGTRNEKWMRATLEAVANDVRSTGKGGRNVALNNAAIRLGHYVAGGHIDQREVEAVLFEAATAAGLGRGEARATIASGLGAGMRDPMDPPAPTMRREESRGRMHETMPADGELPPEAYDDDGLDDFDDGAEVFGTEQSAPTADRSEGERRTAGWQARLLQSIEANDRAGAMEALERLFPDCVETVEPIAWLSPDDIFAPVPPVDWLVPGLQIAMGRWLLWAGYAASAKTLSMQSMLLSLASGRDVFGEFRVPRPFKVRHLDAEQGAAATRRRYQRLLIGHGIDREEIGDRLELASFAPVYLTDSDAEDKLRRIAEGVDLVVGDSLRALCVGIDENASDIRRPLDLLSRVSDQTGTAFSLIHHSNKTSENRTDGREKVRGSSGILDSAGAGYLLTGAGQDPRLVKQIKCPADAAGGEVEPFYLVVEDVGPDGVRVVYKTAEQVAPGRKPTATFDAQKERIVEIVRAERTVRSKSALVARVGGNRSNAFTAIDELIEDGALALVGQEVRLA